LAKKADDALYSLSPEEAARLMGEKPDEVYLRLRQFIEDFGLTGEELLGELRSGRLKARGRPTEGGYDSVAVSMTDAIRWLSGTPLGRRAYEVFKLKNMGKEHDPRSV
jgi:hypothetical protein